MKAVEGKGSECQGAGMYSHHLPTDREWQAMERELQNFVTQFPEAAELVKSNPVLALCLARVAIWDTAYGQGDPVSLTRQLLLGRRREALQFLGFPGTEAAVKFFARIPLRKCSMHLLLRMRRPMQEQPGLLKLLGRLPEVDEHTLHLAAYWCGDDCVTPGYFREIAMKCRGVNLPVTSVLGDIARLSGELGKTVRRRFSNGRQASRYHDALVAELNARNGVVQTCSGWFPPPPKGGTAHIIPLTQPHLLVEEARMQHHCAVIYRSDVEVGRLYFYRILQPERATLCIARDEGGWGIREMKAACNAEVSETTCRAVEDWLAGQDVELSDEVRPALPEDGEAPVSEVYAQEPTMFAGCR